MDIVEIIESMCTAYTLMKSKQSTLKQILHLIAFVALATPRMSR